jgi:hypothetical protein
MVGAMTTSDRRPFTVSAVPTDGDLAPGDLLFEGSRGWSNRVGMLIRIGTWSRYNHVGVVLGQHGPHIFVSAEAYGDRRGAAVRCREARPDLGPVLRIGAHDATAGQRVATEAARRCGRSGAAWLDGRLDDALTLPGTRYGWLSIVRIALRSARRLPLVGVLVVPLLMLLRHVPDLDSLICSEHVRGAVEAAVGVELSERLPAYETSPQDLLSLLLDDGFIA